MAPPPSSPKTSQFPNKIQHRRCLLSHITTACLLAGDMGPAPAAASRAVAFPTSADVALAGALLCLADSPPAPLLLAVSDELPSYSGSSSSYSVASARSCVSDAARRSRPVDPLRVLAVIASLRRIDPKLLARATSKLFQGEPAKRRKGVWIEVSNGDEEEDGEESGRGSVVASEGSTITGAASSRSTATSGRCRRPPLASGGCESLVRRADSIMEWLSRPKAAPATETAIRAAVGDNAVTSKALRWLLKQKRGLRRAGTGGRPDPYVYMIAG